MKVVKFLDQERVDQNDMEAWTDLMVGEFRRTLRAVVLGDTTETGIIRGFKVEPQPVPDATVRIRLDPGGGVAPGAAILAENDTINVIRGQLAGDRGAENALEGNATYTLDFSLDAVNTYYVECTFAYQDGESDNRAFWNDSTNTEFISSEPTRRLPTLSFHKVLAPAGGEWTPLATVVWGGATITAGNITDTRRMLFEGTFPNQQSTQSGTGAMADFSRSTPRADVTHDGIYNVLRKIGRQIQDLKGPNENGQWDFFSRPIKPLDPTNLLATGVTRSLATMDSLEYVVGDGTTTWGDFSGSNGLQLCLNHIQSAQASLPPRIRIRLKSRGNGAGRTLVSDTPIWVMTAGFTLTTTKHIEIVGDISGADQAYGRVPVEFTSATTQFNLNSSVAGSLTLRNIKAANVPSTSFFLGTSARLMLDNSLICSQAITASTNGSALIWKNSEVYGAIHLSHDDTFQDIDGFTLLNCRVGARTLYSQAVDGFFRFWRGASNLIASATTFATQGSFYGCELFYSEQSFVPGVLPGVAREACIDMRGASEFVYHNCNFSFPNSWNGILLGNHLIDEPTGSRRLKWDSCRFGVGATPDFAVVHDVNAGYSTTEGTGWHIYGETLVSTINSTTIDAFIRTVSIKNCTWISAPRVDSGCIKLKNGMKNISIEDCHFEDVTFPASTLFTALRRLYFISFTQDSAYAQHNSSGLKITGCSFRRIVSTDVAAHVPDIRQVNLTRVRDVHVTRCLFECSDANGASNQSTWQTATNSEYAGVQLNQCFDAYVSDCTFTNFPGTLIAAAIMHRGTNITPFGARVTVKHNHFDNCKFGMRFQEPVSIVLTFDGNTFDAEGDSAARMLKANTYIHSTSNVRMRNNTVLNTPGALSTIVEIGDPARVIFTGNDLGDNGRIIHDSGMPGFVIGWNTTPQMNLVGAWS